MAMVRVMVIINVNDKLNLSYTVKLSHKYKVKIPLKEQTSKIKMEKYCTRRNYYNTIIL